MIEFRLFKNRSVAGIRPAPMPFVNGEVDKLRIDARLATAWRAELWEQREEPKAKYPSLLRPIGAIEGGGPERFAKAQQILGAEDCEIVAVYGLLGGCDILAVVECPDN